MFTVNTPLVSSRLENPITAFGCNSNNTLDLQQYYSISKKKATNSSKNKLGQGGYVSVYKGTLQDGSLVAVKVLSESIGNSEEFINKVASISVTTHVNVVSLLGFYLEVLKELWYMTTCLMDHFRSSYMKTKIH
jgi:hypothetical protein